MLKHKEAGVGFFSVSEAPDAVSRVHVDLACNGPLVVVLSMSSTVQNAVYNVDYGHFKCLDLARESQLLFRLRGPAGPWNLNNWPCY